MKKFITYLAMLSVVLILFVVFTSINKQSIAEGLDSAMDKFDISAYQVADNNTLISIVVNDNEDKLKILKHLESRIGKSELDKYSVDFR